MVQIIGIVNLELEISLVGQPINGNMVQHDVQVDIEGIPF